MSDVRVFINYRRRDTRHVAGRLRDRIVTQFGPDAVFVDVESILPGQDYVQAIDEAVSRCLVMCVLVGETWLRPDPNGRRRIDDEHDRLRLEIEAGLRHRTVVIPVLVDEATMPKAADLPPSLQPLSRHQAVRIRYDSFTSDSDHLLTVIGRIAANDEHVTEGTIVADTHTETTRTSRDSPSVVRRPAQWTTVAALVLAALYLVATSSEMDSVVRTSRAHLPASGWWGALVWLLPVLPVAVAILLSVTRAGAGAGVALGCVAGAAWWVVTSLVLVAARVGQDTVGRHAVVLILLVLAAVGLVVARPELRARGTPNGVGAALHATLLMLAAIGLRGLAPWLGDALTGTSQSLSDVLGANPESLWLAVLAPVVFFGPVVVAALSVVQLRALVTAALLQVLYPCLTRLLTFSLDAAGGNQLRTLVIDLLFLAGCLCMLSSVRTVQLRKLQREVQAPAGGVGVPR
jgi:hypothetical protein